MSLGEATYETCHVWNTLIYEMEIPEVSELRD